MFRQCLSLNIQVHSFFSRFSPISVCFICYIRVKMSPLPSDKFSRKIFFEIRNDFPRQSPGSIQSTLRCFRSVDSSEKQLYILEIGCDSSVTTIELSK
jgi:hypothetical protein